MKRPCLACGAPTTGSRCPTCTTHRPSAHARGYNTQHRQARAQLAELLPTPCGYGCGTILTPTNRWVAAHVHDNNPEAGWLAACPPCNENAKHHPTPIPPTTTIIYPNP